MNNDLINRETLKKAIDHFQYTDDFCVKHQIDNSISLYMLEKIIDNAPTVDISKEVWNKSNELLNKRLSYLVRPQGEWKLDSLGAYCSECGTHPDYSSNYCPNCGADMRGAE